MGFLKQLVIWFFNGDESSPPATASSPTPLVTVQPEQKSRKFEFEVIEADGSTLLNDFKVHEFSTQSFELEKQELIRELKSLAPQIKKQSRR